MVLTLVTTHSLRSFALAMKLLAILPFLSISAVLARHAERASEDPLIYNINNVYQCGQPSIQWRTSAPPCNMYVRLMSND